jgi:hypothetical protein
MSFQLPEELQALLVEFQEAWGAHDRARLETLWDNAYPYLVYVAEERPKPMLGWSAICDYYRETLDLMTWMKVKVKPLSADVLGEVAWIVCKGSWGGQNRTRDTVSSGNATVCFLARRCAAGWRLIQYVEAPLNAKYARPETDV